MDVPITIEQVEKAINDVYLLVDKGIIRIILATILGNRLDLSDKPIWLLILAGSSSGKCFQKGTNILMYDGTTKKVEDICVGDQLMGDDSTPRNVLKLGRGKEEMYEVQQEKGNSYTVNESHILSLVYSTTEKKYKSIERNDKLDISVNDYLKKNKTFKNKFKGYKVPVEFKAQKIDLDPYFLGIWLGDGTQSKTQITNPDPEIRHFISMYAQKMNMNFKANHPENRCVSYAINRVNGTKQENLITKMIRAYGLNKQKYIPFNYKVNTREIRLQVLAGLLDTDGYYDKEKKHFDFITKYEVLGNDIVFLCRSLGLHASINKCRKGIKSIGFMGTYYRIYINGDLSQIPTKIKRKQATKHFSNRNHLYTGIKLKSKGIGDYYGFQIDGNKRFLLGDFTVAHNTSIMDIVTDCGPWITPIDTITTNTFASGFRADDEASLLHKANKGILVFKDFTTITSMNEEGLREIMGQLRAIYDGTFNKKTGNLANVDWKGKIGVLAGGTGAAARKMRQFSEQGERFINYILQVADSKEMAIRAMDNVADLKTKEKELREIVSKFVNQKLGEVRKDKLIIPRDIKLEMINIADFATQARSPVIMDKKDPTMVAFVGDREQPSRMAMMLANIATALMIISDEDELSPTNASIIYKTALDSIPIERRMVLRVLAQYREANTKSIAQKLHYNTIIVRGWCNQLNSLKMISRTAGGKGKGASDIWKLDEEFKKTMCKYEKIEEIDEILEATDDGGDDDNAYITDEQMYDKSLDALEAEAVFNSL